MIFSVFQKNWVFGYSWSTLLWYRCYYPHRSRDALSPVCGIFLKDKSRNLFKIVSVLRSASVERLFVSRMRDFSWCSPETVWIDMVKRTPRHQYLTGQHIFSISSLVSTKRSNNPCWLPGQPFQLAKLSMADHRTGGRMLLKLDC